MGIDPRSFNDKQLGLISAADRRPMGKAGMTSGEALTKETKTLERSIHNQFTGFCNRTGVDVWHSNPCRKSSIGEGLPDFLCLKNGIGVCIEFKVLPNKLSRVQTNRIARLRENGNTVHVCEESGPGTAYADAINILTKLYSLNQI
jgi:hypothetical protein